MQLCMRQFILATLQLIPIKSIPPYTERRRRSESIGLSFFVSGIFHFPVLSNWTGS
jgi:hypothetical protein